MTDLELGKIENWWQHVEGDPTNPLSSLAYEGRKNVSDLVTEVRRLKELLTYLHSVLPGDICVDLQKAGVLGELAAEYSRQCKTAGWNAAIEAAAKQCRIYSRSDKRVLVVNAVQDRILALKRPAEGEQS